MHKVGIDIGGTFTDCVIIDGEGRTTIAKALTTPADPSAGVLEALAAACRTSCWTQSWTRCGRSSGWLRDSPSQFDIARRKDL